MGFGRTLTSTTLGQPLDFSARVLLDADETLGRECVSAEVFAGDAKVPPANVRVHLETANESGQRNLRVTTTTLIDEPVVTVELSMGCGSRVSRRFVAFIDPPLIRLADAQRNEGAEPRTDVADSAVADIARNADASRRRAAPATSGTSEPARRVSHELRAARHGARGHRVASASRATRSGVATPSNRATTLAVRRGSPPATPAQAAGPRLQLDAPSMVAAAAPAASLAESGKAAAAEAAAASAATAAAQALALERDRIRVLEAGLAQLHRDSEATQKTMALLQARLRDAEGARYANGFVYVLAALVAFFALLAAALWALRPRQRRRATWHEGAGQQARPPRDAASPVPSPNSEAAALLAGAIEPPSRWKESSRGFLHHTAPASIGGLEVTTVLGPSAARAAAPMAAATTAKRSDSLSMEELIDLEQQAEFFVVLGQDEAAIALLENHLRSDNVISPLPYLQLLEIHQRRGDQPAYERVREAFQERFKAFAPEWSSDLHFGRSLDGYASTIARLQALWATPMHAMRVLDGLLFRRSEGDEAFDFPAYRDLLFLYSIARELAGQVETDFGSIDLFLPLEAAAHDDVAAAPSTISHAVDLDISRWHDSVDVEPLAVKRSVGAR